MISGRDFRPTLASVLAALLVCPPARALVTLNDGHDRIFVTGTASVSRDSNIFANSDAAGDFVYSSGLSAEYTRRAGWIGVNAHASISTSTFAKFKSEDFINPALSVELTKQTGRTTGSFTLSAARESRADAAANVRTDSWNYNSALAVKYPIVSTYTFAGQFGYSSRKYVEKSFLANLATYSMSADLFHILGAEREMSAGYRYRYSETSRQTSSTDHSASLGMSGKIIRGITGSVRAGYQTRIPQGGLVPQGKYSSWTASASSTHAISKKMSVSGSLSKDFSTTAADSSVDVLAASLDLQYAYSSHLSLTASAGAGDSQFLGESGRVLLAVGPPLVLGPQRHDDYLNCALSGAYSLNEHLKLGVTYTWFKNWSTLPLADFVRSAWSANISSRW